MRSLCLILLLLASSAAYAQQLTTQVIKSKLSKADSSASTINHKIDSIQGKVNALANPHLRLNAVKNRINKRKARKDSIAFHNQLANEKKKVKSIINSLEKSGQPSEKYKQQLDSLDTVTYNPKQRTSLSKANDPKQKSNSIRQKIHSKEDSLALSGTRLQRVPEAISTAEQSGARLQRVPEVINTPVNKAESTVNEKLNLMNSQGGAGANLPSNSGFPDANINTDLHLNQPGLNIDNPIGKIDNPLQGQIGDASKEINEVKGIPQEQIGKVKSIDEVKSIEGKMGEANVITDKAQAYGSDVQNIAKGNLSEVKEAPKALESQISKMDEVSGIQKEAGALNQYKDLAAKGNDPEALKQEALKQASTLAVDHFAGQGEVLKQAMGKVSKLKSKYSSLKSLSEIPKRRPNEMKDKPFIERIVPGITFQIQKNRNVLVDYNPNIGYRFYGRFTAGAGWNERVTIGKHVHLSLRDRIYGPRVFADFKIGKGFSVRTDIEKMNTYIPSLTSFGLHGDPSHRAWVWSAFIGLKKEYKFMGKVKGSAQFLYNLYDDHYNSPYADRFAVRMGFEFPMKKKPKP